VRTKSLSRNTVRKYLRTPVAEPPKYRRKAATTKLAPFVETVKMALLADARRHRTERRTPRQQIVEFSCSAQVNDGGSKQLRPAGLQELQQR
jgi:hypothetical protein